VGPVAPPENAKEKAWTDDPGTAAVGRGAIALSMTGSRGDTQGELTGPLGDLKVSGVFDGTELRANLLPKDPKADTAMTGFMALTGSGGPPPANLRGTLRVSNRDARIVRDLVLEGARTADAFASYGAERMARMERLRFIADLIAISQSEDADNRPARRAYVNERMATMDPEIMGLLMGAFAGPETVPAELLDDSLFERIRSA
jgi:hypothetical protein